MEGITELINAHTISPEKQILCNVNALHRKHSWAYFVVCPIFIWLSCSVRCFTMWCVPAVRIASYTVIPEMWKTFMHFLHFSNVDVCREPWCVFMSKERGCVCAHAQVRALTQVAISSLSSLRGYVSVGIIRCILFRFWNKGWIRGWKHWHIWYFRAFPGTDNQPCISSLMDD